MALISKSTAKWQGSLTAGKGSVNLDSSGIAQFPVNWKARSESHDSTTNPEELLAAAHATCFSMALSNALSGANFTVESIQTSAEVTFQPGTGITDIALHVEANIPGISEADFIKFAEDTKVNCPVSKALSAVPMTVDARLIS